jgi:hypothetical protein
LCGTLLSPRVLHAASRHGTIVQPSPYIGARSVTVIILEDRALRASDATLTLVIAMHMLQRMTRISSSMISSDPFSTAMDIIGAVGIEQREDRIPIREWIPKMRSGRGDSYVESGGGMKSCTMLRPVMDTHEWTEHWLPSRYCIKNDNFMCSRSIRS